MATPAFQQSLTNYAPAASYGTYSNYAPVGSPAWAKAYGLNQNNVMANLNNTTLNPYSSGTLAQANGVSSGLADFLMKQNHGLGSGQFLQAAGFTNAPGSQTMMNQAGRNWMFANDPSYNGGHVRFGFTAQGVPYSYRAVNGGPQINQWAMKGGATPNGVTTYNQFALPSNFMANLNSQMPVSTAQPSTLPGLNNPAATGTTQANPYGAGYTGFGNINLSTSPGGTTTNTNTTASSGTLAPNTNPTGAGPQGQAPGTAGSWVAGPSPVTNVNTNASALPQPVTNPAGTSGQGSFISTSVPQPRARTNMFAGGNPNFNEAQNPTTMQNLGQASLRYPRLSYNTR